MTAALSTKPFAFEYDPATLARERRPRMLVSLLASSALVALALLLAGSLARLLPRESAVEISLPPVPHPVPDYRSAPPQMPAPATPRVSVVPVSKGIPVPKPELAAPAEPLVGRGEGEDVADAPPQEGIILGSSPRESEDRPINQPGEPPLVDRLPVVNHSVKPTYEELALSARVEGLVLVFLLVGRDGHVRDARVDSERHVPMLDSAALAAARQWRFEPALRGGRPVPVWVSVPFRFSLVSRD
jgi:periplasmic protein TonB